MERENENFNELPETIVDRLRQEEQSVSIISPKIDEIILAKARSQFADREPTTAVPIVRPAWVAIAAAVVLAVIVMKDLNVSQSPAPSQFADVDNSGSVDIVDVFSLARLRDRDPSAVSQEQIDALMSQIVSLTGIEDAS